MFKKENSFYKSRRDNILVEINNTHNPKCRRHDILKLFRSYGTIDWSIAIVSTNIMFLTELNKIKPFIHIN